MSLGGLSWRKGLVNKELKGCFSKEDIYEWIYNLKGGILYKEYMNDWVGGWVGYIYVIIGDNNIYKGRIGYYRYRGKD